MSLNSNRFPHHEEDTFHLEGRSQGEDQAAGSFEALKVIGFVTMTPVLICLLIQYRNHMIFRFLLKKVICFLGYTVFGGIFAAVLGYFLYFLLGSVKVVEKKWFKFQRFLRRTWEAFLYKVKVFLFIVVGLLVFAVLLNAQIKRGSSLSSIRKE